VAAYRDGRLKVNGNWFSINRFINKFLVKYYFNEEEEEAETPKETVLG